MVLIIGLSGFLFVLLSDVSQLKSRNRRGTMLSIIGYCGVTGALFFSVLQFPPKWTPLWAAVVTVASAVLFVVLLFYSLFIDIPVHTPPEEQQERKASSKGTYGLVRHPGFLWFLFLNVSLAFLIRDALFTLYAGGLILMDFLLVVIEDTKIFPVLFTDYKAYKSRVPFIVPALRGKKGREL